MEDAGLVTAALATAAGYVTNLTLILIHSWLPVTAEFTLHQR
jgi:hypothetical protein